MAKHEECMKDPEYRRTYEVLRDHRLSYEMITEVVVKSNGMVGVGVVSFKDEVGKQLDELMRGY